MPPIGNNVVLDVHIKKQHPPPVMLLPATDIKGERKQKKGFDPLRPDGELRAPPPVWGKVLACHLPPLTHSPGRSAGVGILWSALHAYLL